MRTFILSILVVIAAGCALPSGQQPTKPRVEVPPPPLPAPLTMMKRQSVRAFAASSAEITAVPTAGVADTNSPHYGVVGTFPIDHEDGSKGIGVYIQWNNWPSESPYVIQRSADLKTWTDVVYSVGDAGRVLAIFDLDQHEFYRINQLFVGGNVQ